MSVPVIEVRVWGKRVGAIAPDPKLGFYAFAYDPSWRRTGIELAPLTMPLEDQREAFVFTIGIGHLVTCLSPPTHQLELQSRLLRQCSCRSKTLRFRAPVSPLTIRLSLRHLCPNPCSSEPLAQLQ